MTAREYLGSVRQLQHQIDANTEQIQRLRSLAERATAAYGLSSGGGSFVPDRRAELVARIIDMENNLSNQNEHLIETWKQVSAEIDQLPNEAHRTVLKMRYLGNASIIRIADKMDYSERQVRRIHARALREFEKRVLECPHKAVV